MSETPNSPETPAAPNSPADAPTTRGKQFPAPDAAVVLHPLEATGETLNWGIVSTGNIARKVAADLRMLPDANLAAVTSRSEESAQAFAREFNVQQAYWDQPDGKTAVQQLADNPDVDVVYVATPHAQHYEIVSQLLAAKKNVLVEKAIALNAAQAETMIQLAKDNNVFLMEAVWSRFVPGTTRAFELIEQGVIGEPSWLQANMGFAAEYDLSHRIWDKNAGGGALLDLTIYPLTWALGTLGFPDTVEVRGQLADNGVDAQNTLTLIYGDNDDAAIAQLHSTLVAQTPSSVTVGGELGWLATTEGPLHNPRAITYQVGTGEPVTERFTIIGSGYVYELREVTRCIQQGRTSSAVMDWESSLAIMSLFDSVLAELGVDYRGGTQPGE